MQENLENALMKWLFIKTLKKQFLFGFKFTVFPSRLVVKKIW